MRAVVLLKILLLSTLLAGCGSELVPEPQMTLQSAAKSARAAVAPVVLTGPRANYTIAAAGTGYTVTDKTGKDAPRNIGPNERLRFTDTSLAFEIDGIAGKAYRLYQAAFARTPDAGGLGYWIGAMDRGESLAGVAGAFISSPEFKLAYGAAPTNREVVDKFYRNVLDREGEPGGFAYWLGLLDEKRITFIDLLTSFSESPENKAALLKVIKDGVPFEEFGVAYTPADTPAGQPAGAGTLSAAVTVLAPADSARILSRSNTKLTFSGVLALAPGKVVLSSDAAFKVVSSVQVGGNTVVTVTAPALEELFDTLQIKGTYTANASQVELESGASQATVRARQSTTAAADSFRFTSSLVDGNTTLNSTLSGGVQATVNYDFQASRGGLRSASVDLNVTTRLASQLRLAERSSVKFEKRVGAVRIPIPVSIADRVLGAVGVRVVSLYIPFYVGASLSSEFDVRLSRVANVGGMVGISYDVVNGATVRRTIGGTLEDTAFTSVTPAGAPALATFKESASVYLKARPALAFLDTVALLGVDLTLSGDASAQLQAPVPVSPFYCLVTTPSVSMSAFGYLKGAAFKEERTSTSTALLWTGIEARYGSCTASTIISASVAPAEGTVGAPMTVSASVALDPKFAAAPGVAPTGQISVSGAGGSCKMSLSAQGTTSASGSCVLTPTSAGAPATFKLDYSGDAKYSPSGKTLQAPVKGPQFAGTYVGTFSGDDSGTFQIVITAGGAISGTGTSPEGTFGVSGAVDLDGKLVFSTGGSTSTGAVFNGAIVVSGAIATIGGTWSNAEFNEKGTFGGTRQ